MFIVSKFWIKKISIEIKVLKYYKIKSAEVPVILQRTASLRL